jgi:hypothetical protein
MLKEIEMAPGHLLGVIGGTTRRAQLEQANRLPAAKSMWMSSWWAAASKSLPVTIYGGTMPNANCNRLVSRIASSPLVCPDLPERGAVLAPVKDAPRRFAVAFGHP